MRFSWIFDKVVVFWESITLKWRMSGSCDLGLVAQQLCMSSGILFCLFVPSILTKTNSNKPKPREKDLICPGVLHNSCTDPCLFRPWPKGGWYPGGRKARPNLECWLGCAFGESHCCCVTGGRRVLPGFVTGKPARIKTESDKVYRPLMIIQIELYLQPGHQVAVHAQTQLVRSYEWSRSGPWKAKAALGFIRGLDPVVGGIRVKRKARPKLGFGLGCANN